MLNVRPMGKNELADFLSQGEPSSMEYFKASVSDGFDNTSIGVALDQFKESRAAGFDAKSEQGLANHHGVAVSNTEADESLKTFTKQEWEASEYFRDGVKFQDNWSEGRAKYLAESYDERKEREIILAKGDTGLARKGLGFAGQMIGSLPDPINLIPIGSGVKVGGAVASKIAGAAIEGAVGNIAVSAIARPYFEDRGVESTYQDYVNDLWIGGVMGGAFASAGHAYSKIKERRANISLGDRANLAKAGDAAIEANIRGEDVDLSKIEGLQKSFDSVYEIPEVQRSRKVQDLQEQLTGMGYSLEDAQAHISPLVAHAEAFARDFDMSIDDFMDKFGADFQSSEFIGNGSAKRISKRPVSEIDFDINNMVNAEIDNMKMEIQDAQAGQKIFVEGEFKGDMASTFPQWFKDLGFKSKEEFLTAVKNKTTDFDKIKTYVTDKLEATDPEYQALTGAGMAEVPTGPDGEALFQKKFNKETKGVARGAISLSDSNKSIIHLFEKADQSTIVHETGHLFLNNLERFSQMENAPESIRADFGTIKDWMGVGEDGKIKTEHHEKFARGFEQFLREGKAPRPELQSVFTRFKDWLKSIYSSSKDLKVNLSDEAREVYSRLLGGENRPQVGIDPELKAPEAVFKTEAEIDAKVSEVSAIVDTVPGVARPEEISAFSESIRDIELEDKALDEVMTFFQGAKDEKALQEAAAKVGISKSQFERIIDDFNEKLLKEDESRLGIEKLIEQKRGELAAEAAELKRQAYLSLSARTQVMSHVDTIMKKGGSPKDSVLSILEGVSHLRGIEGAGNSVDGSYMALAQTTSSKCFTELRKVDSKIEKLFENDVQFNQNVIKEMINPGSTGDEVAQASGEILSRYSNEMRERANLAGAKIGKLEGHVPRTHDADKMIGKMDEWVEFMMSNLDEERSLKGLNEAGKREALVEVYASLVSGNHGAKEVDITEPLRRVPRNIAKKMGESRSLHFRSPEVELAYLKQFGQGENILQSMASHYESMSKKIAMMERLGPNPENTITHAIQKIHDDIKQKIISKEIDSKEAQKILDEMGDVSKMRSRDSEIGHAMMQALGEVDTTQGWFKSTSQIIRAVNSLSKLGSALLSQPGDMVHAVNERRLMTDRNEASLWVEALKDYFSKPDKELQDVLDHVGIFVDSINYKNFNRFDADNINNKLARANDWMYRWTGQNWHVKNTKNAAALSLSREMGANISKAWKDVHPGLKEMLSQYGSINEAKWKKLQLAKPFELDGKSYYHPGMIAELADDVFEDMIPQEFQSISQPQELPIEGESAPSMKKWEEKRASEIKRARFKLEMDLKTFFVEESRNSAPEPDAKVRRVMNFGNKSGTKTAEAIKLLTQFKTFAFVNWDRSIKGKRMMRDSSDFGGVAHHAVATLALGYFSTVLKDLAKGVQPQDPTEMSAWGRAAMQSGGLGIMGDFFGSAYSARSGSDVLSSMAGPTVSTISNASVLALKGLHGETYEDGSKYASKWIDFGRSLAPAPFSSMWYTRAAMDHLIWQNLKETLEPGSIRRSERRLKKQYKQKYIISPRKSQWLPQMTR